MAKLSKVKRIIAIGDLHGDYDLMIKLLRLGKVIDENNNWIGKDTVVVQVGDQIDRCRPMPGELCTNDITYQDENSDLRIIYFMDELHEKAKKDGGKVISLLGNHEILNFNGIMSYVSKKGIDGVGGIEKRKKIFERGGPLSKEFAKNRDIFVIIGRNVFVHGGILPLLLDRYNNNLNKINKLVKKWLVGEELNIDELLFSEKISPLWVREYGTHYVEELTCDKLYNVFSKIEGVDKMIIGHTPQLLREGRFMNSVCNGSLYRIDLGSSRAFYNFKSEQEPLQVLEILDDEIYNVISEPQIGGFKKYYLKKMK